jgi:hypothetical protein
MAYRGSGGIGDFWSTVQDVARGVTAAFNPQATGVNPSYNPANPQLPGPFNPVVTVAPKPSETTNWLLYGGLALAAYMLLRKRR